MTILTNISYEYEHWTKQRQWKWPNTNIKIFLIWRQMTIQTHEHNEQLLRSSYHISGLTTSVLLLQFNAIVHAGFIGFYMKTRSTQSANWVLAPLDRFAPACPVLCLWKPPFKINNICIERFHSYLGGLVNSLWHSKATLTSALQWLSFRKTSSLFSNKQKTETSSRFSNLDK